MRVPAGVRSRRPILSVSGAVVVVLAVTGGTGRYSNVRGWVRIKQISLSGKSVDLFHLAP